MTTKFTLGNSALFFIHYEVSYSPKHHIQADSIITPLLLKDVKLIFSGIPWELLGIKMDKNPRGKN